MNIKGQPGDLLNELISILVYIVAFGVLISCGESRIVKRITED
jgi:hypothetical protein